MLIENPRKVKVGDIEAGYEILGDGPPLIMICGFSATMDNWAPRFIEQLARKFRVIVFDNRGMGETTAGTEEFTIDRFADDTAGFMDALGIERAHVLGWSMGGDVALSFALRHPDKVDRLIVYAGDCGGTQRVVTDEVYREIEMFSDPDINPAEYLSVLFPGWWMEQNPEYWKDFTDMKETSDYANIRTQGDAYLKWEGVFTRLGDIARPTLIVSGTEDISTPVENARILANHIPGAWLVWFEGGGHGAMFQFPEQFAKVIITFVEASVERRQDPCG